MATEDISAYFLSKYFAYDRYEYFEDVFILINVTTNLDIGAIPKGVAFFEVAIWYDKGDLQNIFGSIDVQAYITAEEFDEFGLNKEDFPGMQEDIPERENDDTGEIEDIPDYIINLTEYFNFELTITSKQTQEKLQ